jgi:hypothetical protein
MGLLAVGVQSDVERVAAGQGGVVSREQLRELGISRELVRQQLRARRWQRALPGAYVVFTGPLPPMTRVWAGLVYAGGDAVASHATAAWLDGLADSPPDRVDVLVLHGRRHRMRGSRPGVRVRQTRHLEHRRHPAAVPPRTRIEETVLDLADEYGAEERVIGTVLRACQRRLTTAARLRDRLRARKRARWRRLLQDLLADVVDGVASPLERRYRDSVERAHGLPRGRRNRPEADCGRRRYRDVRYRRWRTIVELDGRAAHPDEWQERDDLRDAEVLAAEDSRTVRLGWIAVTTRSCAAAAVVARLLRRGGWTGRLVRCGADCKAI